MTSSQSVIPTCYRHPDRETRLACSNCDRPVCVECVRPAAVGQRCLECSQAVGTTRVVDMDEVERAANRPPAVTMAILVISAGLFVVTEFLPGLGSAVVEAMVQFNPAVAAGDLYRLVTAAFLHSSFMHVAFNMYALYVFGPSLERDVGPVPFAAMYLATAVAGGVLYFLMVPGGAAVGASGAIFGLFGVWLVAAYRGRRTVMGLANLRQLLMLLGINLVIGFVPGTRIAWQAHVGGLLAGIAIAWLWSLPAIRDRAALRTLAAAGVGVAALLLVL